MHRFLKASTAVLVFLLLALTVPTRAVAQTEEILSFDSVIEVNTDSTLLVTETIEVYAAGNQIKRGIFRDFPTVYGKKDGRRHVVGFDVVSVMKNGRPEPYHLERRRNGMRVYIGKQDVFLTPGFYTYELTYTTTRQLGFFADHDELYWNVTGNDWDFRIRKTTASVQLPAAAAAAITGLDGYTGPQGSVERAFTATEGTFGPLFETTRAFQPGEGLTIVVMWGKGHIASPGPWARFKYFLDDNTVLILSVGFLVVVLVYFLFMWTLVGKDPEKGTIIPLFHPPERMSPAAMRYLMHMDYDNKAFTAAILQMAVKGTVRIVEKDIAGLPQWAGRLVRASYVLKRTKQHEHTLTPVEKSVLDALFGGGLSLEMKNENHVRIKGAIKKQKDLLSKQVEDVYFFSNRGYFYKGVMLSVVGGAALWWYFTKFCGGVVGLWELLPWPAVIGVNYLFLRLLKAPTAQGRKIMDHIEGFKMFLTVTEKERLNLLNPPEKTPELFEKYLPFALALDVEQKWGEQFTQVLQQAVRDGYRPSWYSGRSWSHMSCSGFTSSLGSSFAGAIASSSVPPGSSSGGGGFSGGGGGGGGGGGW